MLRNAFKQERRNDSGDSIIGEEVKCWQLSNFFDSFVGDGVSERHQFVTNRRIGKKELSCR